MKTMLDLSREVLPALAFDKKLFRKELRKMTKWLDQPARMALYAWCLTYFSGDLLEIVKDVMNS